MGNSSSALAEAEQETDEESRLAILARIYLKLDRTADAHRALSELESKFADSTPYDIAVVHAARGEADAALDWLERAYRQRDGTMIMLKVDPNLESVRNTPRYLALLKKMNLT